ncbi:MAG: FHA domain-containing protein [Clostridia bacterium]|nr:FHA domain-containing protein [Clostridia bacterium]
MNKCKIIRKRGVAQIIVKSQKGQQLNEREVYAINNDEAKGLLHTSVFWNGKSFKLVYGFDGFIPLDQYIIDPINKSIFTKLIQGIVDVLHSLNEAYLNPKYLLLGLNQVMVRPDTTEPYFVYVPIQGFECDITVKDFLLSIIQYAQFSENEDSSYVREYISILNNGINFSVFELEEYVKRLNGVNDSPSQKYKFCPYCRTKIPESTTKCSNCDAILIGYKVDKQDITMSAFDWKSVDKPSTPSVPRKQVYDPMAVMTGNIGDDGNKTISIHSGNRANLTLARLTRERTGECIPISSAVFRIGKAANSCNYAITDNNTISRIHADIIIADGRAYIADLKSTNSTYVNGAQLKPGERCEIGAGTRIMLADEAFVFDFGN